MNSNRPPGLGGRAGIARRAAAYRRDLVFRSDVLRDEPRAEPRCDEPRPRFRSLLRAELPRFDELTRAVARLEPRLTALPRRALASREDVRGCRCAVAPRRCAPIREVVRGERWTVALERLEPTRDVPRGWRWMAAELLDEPDRGDRC